MPTMPGFDPGRALARPTGEFVLLRDVSIGLVGEADGPDMSRAMALVNRYMVERVEADLMLGFFFPGATMVGHRRRRGAAAAARRRAGGCHPPVAAPKRASPARASQPPVPAGYWTGLRCG